MDGEDDCQMWRVTSGILDKQLQTSNVWWSLALGLGVGWHSPHPHWN